MIEIKEANNYCSKCIHEYDSPDIRGSYCYMCKRNPTDNRIDWFEEKKLGEHGDVEKIDEGV